MGSRDVRPLVKYENPQGPLIRQGKVMVTRRLSNVIMARAAVYTYEKQKTIEVFLICEVFNGGIWQQVKNHTAAVEDTDKLETYYAFQCEPNKFHRIRAFFMVNNRACRDTHTQRLLVQAVGVWNNWGRDDDLDEPRTTPLNLFYDDTPLPPVEERETFPDETNIRRIRIRK